MMNRFVRRRQKFFLLGILALTGLLACRSGNGRNPGVSSTGTIEADEVRAAFKMGGQVTKLLAEEGSRVKEGDLIAVLDSSSLAIQLSQAEAGVRLADSQLRLLLKGARSEDIRQAEELLKQAEAGLSIARQDLKRAGDLLEKGSATQKIKDDAEARFTVAQAQYNSAAETLKKAKNFARPEEVEAARARLAQAQSAVDLLKKSIADCSLISPASGIITHKAVEKGEFVAPGAAVVTISRLDTVFLMIYVPEADLGRLQLGDAAEVRVDSHPGRIFPGKVVYLSPEAEFTPKNIQTKEERVKLVFGVKIEIENKDLVLKPGLPADAVLKPKS
jgi:HlyD family secretion protein